MTTSRSKISRIIFLFGLFPSCSFGEWKIRAILPSSEEKIYRPVNGKMLKIGDVSCLVNKINEDIKSKGSGEGRAMSCSINGVLATITAACGNPKDDPMVKIINDMNRERGLFLSHSSKNYQFYLYCD